MSPDLTLTIKQKKSKMSCKQKGSALVMAIFIIVVMTLLGSALVRMVSSNAETIAYEVLGTRAYLSAQSGAQFRMQQLFPLNSANTDAVECDDLPANTVPNFGSAEGLHNCIVSELTCTDFTHENVTYYTITSTGQCTIDNEVTSRTIEIEARSL